MSLDQFKRRVLDDAATTAGVRAFNEQQAVGYGTGDIAQEIRELRLAIEKLVALIKGENR